MKNNFYEELEFVSNQHHKKILLGCFSADIAWNY